MSGHIMMGTLIFLERLRSKKEILFIESISQKQQENIQNIHTRRIQRGMFVACMYDCD